MLNCIYSNLIYMIYAPKSNANLYQLDITIG